MNRLTTVILATGYGKRMISELPKVLHKVSGEPMVRHVVDLANEVESDQVVCVVGHGKELVEKALMDKKVNFAIQEVQLGTGHAVKSASDYIKEGEVLVLFGDAPLLSYKTLSEFIAFHRANHYTASLISTLFEDPSGYGRIVRDAQGDFLRIVEHKDATAEELSIKEINSGIGIFEAEVLIKALDSLKNDNKQGEYYLTDVFEWVKLSGMPVGAFVTSDSYEVMGINDRMALAEAEKYHQTQIKKQIMLSGVTLVMPETIFIEKSVQIGQDTIVEPGTILRGATQIGSQCVIGPNSEIIDSKIQNKVKVMHSKVTESSIDDASAIGPFAYLRPKSRIGKNCKIGDFVEVKNCEIGDDTKVSHLTYVGDGVVGKNVNLGCGVVFVNYDGAKKHLTEIEDNVFVGCNTNLIAPVKVGKGAYIAAGSTITDDVPENALAIARERQVNKTNWSNKYQKNK